MGSTITCAAPVAPGPHQLVGTDIGGRCHGGWTRSQRRCPPRRTARRHRRPSTTANTARPASSHRPAIRSRNRERRDHDPANSPHRQSGWRHRRRRCGRVRVAVRANSGDNTDSPNSLSRSATGPSLRFIPPTDTSPPNCRAGRWVAVSVGNARRGFVDRPGRCLPADGGAQRVQLGSRPRPPASTRARIGEHVKLFGGLFSAMTARHRQQ